MFPNSSRLLPQQQNMVVNKGGQELSSACRLKLFSVPNTLPLSVGMKRELQTLREEIKTLAGQIQRKLKSEFSLTSPVSLLGLNLF